MKKVLSILFFAVLSATSIFANEGNPNGSNFGDYTRIIIPEPNQVSGTRIEVGVGLWQVDYIPFFFVSIDRTFTKTLNLYFTNQDTGEMHFVQLSPGVNYFAPIERTSPVTLNTPTSHIGTWKITASIGKKGNTAVGYMTIVADNTINTTTLY